MAYLVANSPSPPLPMFQVNSFCCPRPNLLSVFNSTPRILPSLKCSPISTPSLVDAAAKFQEASKNGNLIPLQQCIFADHLTPVLAYRCLVNEDDREAPSFLFESVEQGAKGTNVVSTICCIFSICFCEFGYCFSFWCVKFWCVLGAL